MTYSHTQPPRTRRSVWRQRLSDPGWLLLPLRSFLGITFVYAGLQKLANPAFFNPTSPLSVAGQMRAFEHTSPIASLVGLAAQLPTTTGLVIALGELVVGVGTLIGAFTRVAAMGGLALSLSFFLTVSWATTPYYYGADIVFAFAWLTVLLAGDHGVWSASGWIAGRKHGTAAGDPSLGRRSVVRVGGLAAAVGALAAITAFTGRIFNTAAPGPADAQSARAAQEPVATPHPSTGNIPTPTPPTSSAPAARTNTAPTDVPSSPATTARTAAAPPARASGKPVGAAASIPVGQAAPFADPATGDPAWLVHTAAGRFVAFDAVCPHAGCTVDYDPASVQFQCPCHGGRFDARTGDVLQGPPQQPLRRIPVHVTGGQLRVDA